MKQEIIKQMNEMYNQGKKQMEIAKELGISQKSVSYWLSSEEDRKETIRKQIERFRNKPLDERRKVYKKRLSYLNNYYKKKYKTNEEFRKSELIRLSKYRKKKDERNKNNM